MRQLSIGGRWQEMLRDVRRRSVIVDGFPYVIQWNASRVRSTMANVASASSQSVVLCPLCLASRPKDQFSLPWCNSATGNSFEVLVNPYPIFRHHLTIVSVDHREQHIDFLDMWCMARELGEGVALFFNGAKCGSSIPGHMHYQAVPADELPLFKEGVEFAKERSFVFSTDSPEKAKLMFDCFMKSIGRSDDNLINVIATYQHKASEVVTFVIFPRKTLRPWQYSAADEDSKLLVSPATVEVSGVIVTPDERTFNRITADDVRDIISQVSEKVK